MVTAKAADSAMSGTQDPNNQVGEPGPVVVDIMARIDQLEQWVRTQGAAPLATKDELQSVIKTLTTKDETNGVIKTLTELINSKPARVPDSWGRSVLESKGIQDVAIISDAKGYRQWNKKLKNALDLIRPKSRDKLEVVER